MPSFWRISLCAPQKLKNFAEIIIIILAPVSLKNLKNMDFVNVLNYISFPKFFNKCWNFKLLTIRHRLFREILAAHCVNLKHITIQGTRIVVYLE